jgi:polygalacturonase
MNPVKFLPPFLLLFSLPLLAQDTRTVTEPIIPKSCAVLTSALAAPLSDESEGRPDTRRIQQALDTCPQGLAVELKPDAAHSAFLTGPLELRQGVTLLIDSGATLFASRNARDYDTSPGACGLVNQKGHGCRALISGDHVSGAAVMGDGTIDGRGPSKILGQKESWWDLAQEAKVKNLNQSCPRIMVLSGCDNFTLYRIKLTNSPNFHVAYSGGNGFTAWGVIIDTGKAGRNTDGIDPGNSTNVTITHSFIRAGDDNVAIKAGRGLPTRNITISHNHFYYGHGMSIGSETDGGADRILVTDLSIDGADNGIRIKSNASRGGLVQNIRYEDVCIKNTKNPIYMDSNYSAAPNATHDKLPQFRDITLHNVRIEGPGKLTFEGYDAQHQLGMTLDGVTLDSPGEIKIETKFADLKFGPGPVNFLSGAGKGPANSCEGKFIPAPR